MWPRLSLSRLSLPRRCALALCTLLYPNGSTSTTPVSSTISPACFVEPNRRSCALYNSRRQRAEHVLTIASAIQPVETAIALRAARAAMRACSPALLRGEERRLLRHVLKEGVARGVACAAGGGVASYAMLRVVLAVIPLAPSARLTRALMGVVAAGAAAVELASVPDLTTIELLLMSDSELGGCGRASIERYDPGLLLLQTLERHMVQLERVAAAEFELQPCAGCEAVDGEPPPQQHHHHVR